MFRQSQLASTALVTTQPILKPQDQSAVYSGFAVALGLSLLLPLLNYFRDAPIGDFASEWMSAVAFSFALAFLARSVPRWQRVNPTAILLPVGLAVVLFIQAVSGTFEFDYDWLICGSYLTLLFFSMLAGHAVRAAGLTEETARRIAWTLIIVSVVNFGAQLAQVLGFDLALYPFVVPLVVKSACRIYGNVAQANHANLVAWLGIAAVLYLMGTDRLNRKAGAVLIAILLLSSALTVSRMAWLFLILFVGLVLALRAWPAPDKRSRATVVAILAAGFVLATIAIGEFLPVAQGGCDTGFDRISVTGAGSTQIRLELWRLAILIWSSSPWIGTGAGSFLPQVYALAPEGRQLPLDAYAHNSLLQILAEFGLIGAGLIVGLGALLLLYLIRNRARLTADDALMIAALGVLVIHCMLEFPLWYAYFLLFFGLLLGMLVRPEWSAAAFRAPVAPMLAAGASMLMVGSAAILYEYRKLDRVHVMVQMKIEMKVASTPEIVSRIAAAADEVVLYRPYAEHLLSTVTPLTRESLEKKIRDSDRLLRRLPQLSTMGQRAVLAVLAGDNETARRHLRRLFIFRLDGSEEAVEEIRNLIAHRPKELGELGRILDEESAQAPKPQW